MALTTDLRSEDEGFGIPPKCSPLRGASLGTTPPTSPSWGFALISFSGLTSVTEKLWIRAINALEQIGEHLEEIDKGLEAIMNNTAEDIEGTLYKCFSELLEAIERHS